MITIWIILDLVGIGTPAIIPGIPIIPSYPIVGNLFSVNRNGTSVYSDWSKRYGDVFQIRLGCKRVIVVNSFEAATDLWIKNSTANNSRPKLHTFHDVVSVTQGFTVGTTPMGPQFQRTRKVVASFLNKKSMNSYSVLISNGVDSLFRRIIHDLKESHLKELNLMEYLQRFTLKTSVRLTYGVDLDMEGEDKELVDKIIRVENQIINLRSPTSNYQDFLPFLRKLSLFLPKSVYNDEKNIRAKRLRDERDIYMNELSQRFQSQFNEDPYLNCLLADTTRTSFGKKTICSNELQSICLTMVSAGLDNTPLNLYHCLGHLSQSYGKELQEIAYKEIMKTYETEDMCKIWERSCDDASCDYLVALIMETLRYFSVLPLSLPRMTTKEIKFRKFVIPKDTTLYLNAYQVDHDSTRYAEAFEFKPSRYLDSQNKLLRNGNEIDHFGFGAGARKCAGSQLATKEMYIILLRIIILFKVKRPERDEDMMDPDPIIQNSNPSATSFEPRLYKIGLEFRGFQETSILKELMYVEGVII